MKEKGSPLIYELYVALINDLNTDALIIHLIIVLYFRLMLTKMPSLQKNKKSVKS